MKEEKILINFNQCLKLQIIQYKNQKVIYLQYIDQLINSIQIANDSEIDEKKILINLLEKKNFQLSLKFDDEKNYEISKKVHEVHKKVQAGRNKTSQY